jgi:hypothetical protein
MSKYARKLNHMSKHGRVYNRSDSLSPGGRHMFLTKSPKDHLGSPLEVKEVKEGDSVRTWTFRTILQIVPIPDIRGLSYIKRSVPFIKGDVVYF